MAERELATRLLAAERDASRKEESDEEVRVTHVHLVHATIPKLEDAGLLEWDREGGTVTTVDHRIYSDPVFEPILEGDGDWDPLISTLADGRRAAVVNELADRVVPVSRWELAAAVRDRDHCGDPFEEVFASLHHVHLPALDDAALIAYDAEGGTVTAGDHPLADRLLAGSKSTTAAARIDRAGEDRSIDESGEGISPRYEIG